MMFFVCTGILHPNTRSIQFSPRRIHDDVAADLTEEKQKGLLNVTIAPRAQLDKKFPLMTMPVSQNETMQVSIT